MRPYLDLMTASRNLPTDAAAKHGGGAVDSQAGDCGGGPLAAEVSWCCIQNFRKGWGGPIQNAGMKQTDYSLCCLAIMHTNSLSNSQLATAKSCSSSQRSRV